MQATEHPPIHLHQHLHLSAGCHATLDHDLVNHWTSKLGAAIRIDSQHAVWQCPSDTSILQGLKAQATQAQHDSCVLTAGLSWRDFSVLAMDMDSTLINIECIDEIADYCGKKAQVAAITEATMRGEITNFDDSLRRRVALLKDVPVRVLDAVLKERLQLNPGAEKLIATAHQHGLKTLLVSGGFTFFTDAMHTKLGLTASRSNTLNHANGKLDGTVALPIVNAAVKRETVEQLCQSLNVSTTQAIAIGDGSNDLDMMSIAGFSVAYHAKPAVQAQAMSAIQFGGLDTLCLWLDTYA